MNIELEATKTVNAAVDETNTAKTVKSGELEVFATPSMIALIEQAASELLSAYLDENQTSVGTKIDVSHLAASTVGSKISASAKITEVDGRKVCFEVEAFDNAGIIGKGTHERFIVLKDRFLQKAQDRLKNAEE